jgi:hypothetical protein
MFVRTEVIVGDCEHYCLLQRDSVLVDRNLMMFQRNMLSLHLHGITAK